jgi:CubicO group peptidase (beta-lactamase class C family)
MATIVAAVLAMHAAVGHAITNQELTTKLDSFIESSMNAYQVVPGLAICVVKGDRAIYERGFGLRNAKSQLPVTPETGFYIASSTKSYVGMAASVLAAEGKLDLDAPISRYLPDMRLPEPLSPDSITVRALLTHRSGINNIPIQIHLVRDGALSKDEFLRMMYEKSKPMATDFKYTNLGYNVAGYILQDVTGNPWQEVVAETVLQPVGMPNTSTSITEAQQREFALPYQSTGDGWKLLELKTDSTMHAAGGIVTTVSDAARWIIVNLHGGMINGRQALPAEAVRVAHTPWATLDSRYYRFHRTGYGLGWYTADFENEVLMHHFGGFDGYHAHISFMPQHDIGVAVFINTDSYDGDTLVHMLAAYTYELLLDHEGADEKYQKESQMRSARSVAMRQLAEEIPKGMALVDAGKPDQATDLFLEALREAQEAKILEEGKTNDLGYDLLRKEVYLPAIAVFEYNTKMHPESPNVFDSLGEAYEKSGKLRAAKEQYAKAYKLALKTRDRNAELFKKNLDRASAELK